MWVTSSSIIKNIEATRATGLASVAHYYFDFKDTGKQDRRGFLSSLLTQLCTQSHHGYDVLSKLYEAHDDGLRQPSEVDLIQCLKDVLALPGQGRVYIIVDAVDESPNRPGIPSTRKGLAVREGACGFTSSRHACVYHKSSRGGHPNSHWAIGVSRCISPRRVRPKERYYQLHRVDC